MRNGLWIVPYPHIYVEFGGVLYLLQPRVSVDIDGDFLFLDVCHRLLTSGDVNDDFIIKNQPAGWEITELFWLHRLQKEVVFLGPDVEALESVDHHCV